MSRNARQNRDAGPDYVVGETGLAAQIGEALIVDRNSLGREKAPQQQRMKKFLVGPARQKSGDFVVAHYARRQQVAQVDDRVRLDIHHVGDREKGVVAEPRLRCGPIENIPAWLHRRRAGNDRGRKRFRSRSYPRYERAGESDFASRLLLAVRKIALQVHRAGRLVDSAAWFERDLRWRARLLPAAADRAKRSSRPDSPAQTIPPSAGPAFRQSTRPRTPCHRASAGDR